MARVITEQEVRKIIAAYQTNPLSLLDLDREVINQLGSQGIIPLDVALVVFGKSIATDDDKLLMEHQLNEAITVDDWATVAAICSKLWFEKPESANKELIAARLAQDRRWSALYEFEKALKPKEYVLTAGPVQKTPETIQLEELARKLMQSGDFIFKKMGNEYYFVFTDGTQFNWTQIQANIDLQNIELNETDFALYQRFMEFGTSELKSLYEPLEYYRELLYRDPATGKNLPRPDPQMMLEEMQAINIYTRAFCNTINGLMTNDLTKFNYNNTLPKILRSAVVHSVMAASGLRKGPIVTVENSYRYASISSEHQLQEYIKAAAQKGVIRLNGLVSSTVDPSSLQTSDLSKRPIFFTFKNLRGVYVAPISMMPEEREFLIPDSKVQLTGYEFFKGQHRFSATLVSDLGMNTQEPSQEDGAMDEISQETVAPPSRNP